MISVAIDGPAGAGKSTIAKLLAKKLGVTYIDTGAMYRTLTYKALVNGINLEDEEKLTELLLKSNIELMPTHDDQVVFLDGIDVTEEIRSPQVSQQVSIVAKHAQVRKYMVGLQQEFAKETSIVMDGRDIGTVVLPNATVKIFLTASIEERARRRHIELLHKGYQPILAELLQDIENRDRIDQERVSSPLVKADDAILIDATTLTIDEVVDQIYRITSQHSNCS